jgi:uncharacterized coiled-coil protein SlyX
MTYDMFTQEIEKENELGKQLHAMRAHLKLPRAEFFGNRLVREGFPTTWVITVRARGRQRYPETEGINFRAIGTTWQDGLQSAAQEALGRVSQRHASELVGSPFEMFAKRDSYGQPMVCPPYTSGSRDMYCVQQHISELNRYGSETRDALDREREDNRILLEERRALKRMVAALQGTVELQKEKIEILEDRVSTLQEELEEAKDEGEQLQDRLDNDALISDDDDYEEDPQDHESEPDYDGEDPDDDEEMIDEEEEDPEEPAFDPDNDNEE